MSYRSEGAGIRLLDPTTGTNITLVTELAMVGGEKHTYN